ncbi:hypothetical protein GUITHDRAFT_100781 [Guillardia theta CCMP2712]|uniref:Uncharacterized protein n=1 Tax=Guillardia theta (strain CCMP2712) TaxID=905079 RepID=L1JZP3_GUITC|nr:hypothetical protein GUITHDRAFT_100781 [Guillardia theta CCMP2712]EKX53812.1 hypothetical protein GUITHDRAFT_100781 [Guillardia theta CCMP2712]|eukprot:XP_005840792.1 hypothetical protein GUITHDRAFT_100781 [Guillardia theta CCMP2712]
MGSEISQPLELREDVKCLECRKETIETSILCCACQTLQFLGYNVAGSNKQEIDYFLNPQLDPVNQCARPMYRDYVWDSRRCRLTRLSELDRARLNDAKSVEQEKQELLHSFLEAKALGSVVETTPQQPLSSTRLALQVEPESQWKIEVDKLSVEKLHDSEVRRYEIVTFCT